MQTLEKNHDYKDEHLDFMQQWIRRFCLQYGAALFYTSAKEDKNCDLLYKYLTHKIYGFPFRTPALVVEKDAVFMYVLFRFICIFLMCFFVLFQSVRMGQHEEDSDPPREFVHVSARRLLQGDHRSADHPQNCQS